MAKTDRQIDSVYSITPADVDALRNGFRAIRDKMDTINAQSIIREKEYERKAQVRDSLIRIYIHKYIVAVSEKEEAEKKVSYITKVQNYAMLFLLIVAGSYFGVGINKYFHKRKCND